MNITANPTEAKINGSTYDIGISLTHVFARIFKEYGMEAGQQIVDEALNLAIKS